MSCGDPLKNLPEHLIIDAALGGGLPSGSEHDLLVHDGSDFAATTTVTGPSYTFDGKIGVGTAPTTPLHALSTTEQLRVGYDSSNYMSMTVRNDGEIWIDSIGTGPGVRFFDTVGVGAGGNTNKALVVAKVNTGGVTATVASHGGAIAGSSSGRIVGTASSISVLSSNIAADALGCEYSISVAGTAVYTADQIGGQFTVFHSSASGGMHADASLIGGNFFIDVNTGTSKTVGHAIVNKLQLLMSSGTTNTINTGYGIKLLTPSGSGHTMTTAYGIKLDDLASTPTITTYYGMRIGDQTDVSITNNEAIFIDAQDGANKDVLKGNINMDGGDWDTGHLMLGAAHVWFDSTNIFMNIAAPASATDGLLFPDTVDTVVARDTTDVLTNKTIDAADNTVIIENADSLGAAPSHPEFKVLNGPPDGLYVSMRKTDSTWVWVPVQDAP